MTDVFGEITMIKHVLTKDLVNTLRYKHRIEFTIEMENKLCCYDGISKMREEKHQKEKPQPPLLYRTPVYQCHRESGESVFRRSIYRRAVSGVSLR